MTNNRMPEPILEMKVILPEMQHKIMAHIKTQNIEFEKIVEDAIDTFIESGELKNLIETELTNCIKSVIKRSIERHVRNDISFDEIMRIINK